MSLKSNEAYIGIGVQGAKGTPNATPDMYVKFLDGTFPTEFDAEHLRESGDDELIGTSVKNQHREKFSFNCIARPEVCAYLFSYLLGKDTISGASDPYTHTIIRSAANERAWLTIRRKIDTNIIQQLEDCRIEKITVTGEAGQKIMLAVEGNALTSSKDTSEDSPVYETHKPFTFYHSNGAFTVDSGVDSNIKAFSVEVMVSSQQGMQTDDILLADLPDLKLDINFSASFYAQNTTRYYKLNYNAGSAPTEDLNTGSFAFTCAYTESTKARQFKMTIKDIVYEPVQLNPNSDPSILEEAIAGIVRKPSSGEIVEVICKNSISSYIYHS